jgi:hypothetical protein
MKSAIIFLFVLALASCSSTRYVDSWKNEALSSEFKPGKILVMAITENLTARSIFEGQLQSALKENGLQAAVSYGVVDNAFTQSKKSESEIAELVEDLSSKGYDAVIISSVRGIENKLQYSPGYGNIHYYWGRFGRYYYVYQDIYVHPEYTGEYQVYHAETAIYNLGDTNENELVWVGSFDISSPISIRKTVDDYVQSLMRILEKDGLVPGK